MMSIHDFKSLRSAIAAVTSRWSGLKKASAYACSFGGWSKVLRSAAIISPEMIVALLPSFVHASPAASRRAMVSFDMTSAACPVLTNPSTIAGRSVCPPRPKSSTATCARIIGSSIVPMAVAIALNAVSGAIARMAPNCNPAAWSAATVEASPPASVLFIKATAVETSAIVAPLCSAACFHRWTASVETPIFFDRSSI